MAGRELVLAAAAATNGPTTLEGILLSLGLPGVVILALGIYARSQIKATDDRARRLEDDNRRLYQIMTDQMIPALTRATDITMEATTLLGDINKQQERQAAIDEARRQIGLNRQDGIR